MNTNAVLNQQSLTLTKCVHLVNDVVLSNNVTYKYNLATFEKLHANSHCLDLTV